MRRVRFRTGEGLFRRHIRRNPAGLDGRPESGGTRRIGVGAQRHRRPLVPPHPEEDVIMHHDDRIPSPLTGRDVAGAWIIAALLFLGVAVLM